jgi:hypothetical protein
MKTVMTPELLEEMKNPEYKEGGGPSFASSTRAWARTAGSASAGQKALGGKELRTSSSTFYR